MSNEQAAEEITLYATDHTPDTPDVQSAEKITLQLQQINKWKQQSLNAQLLDDKFLVINKFQRGRPMRFWVNILFLNPKPQRNHNINWRWGVASIIFLLLNALIITAENAFTISNSYPYFLSSTVLLSTGFVVCLLMVVHKMKNVVEFSTLMGGISIVELNYNRPNKSEFKIFIQLLIQRIQAAQNDSYYDKSSHLAAELGEHRRLQDEKIIGKQTYEQAKNNILSQHTN